MGHHFARFPEPLGVEILDGRKSRFRVVRGNASVLGRPVGRRGTSALREAAGRWLLTAVLLGSSLGAGGAMVMGSEEWRHNLPPPAAHALGSARTSLQHLLNTVGLR
jgi:hypothetical protein